MILLALIAIPIIAALASSSSKVKWDTSAYQQLYRLEDPDRYTPGQRQFDPGFLVIRANAEEVLIRAEDAVSKVSGIDASGMLMKQLYDAHSEGDWGDLEARRPGWGTEQDQRMDSESIGHEIIGVHQVLGNDIWVRTNFDPAGNNTTFYIEGGQ